MHITIIGHNGKMVGNAACLINGFSTNGYDKDVIMGFKDFF